MMQGLDGIVNDKKLNDAMDIIIDPGAAVGVDRKWKKIRQKFGKALGKGQVDKAFGTNKKSNKKN